MDRNITNKGFAVNVAGSQTIHGNQITNNNKGAANPVNDEVPDEVIRKVKQSLKIDYKSRKMVGPLLEHTDDLSLEDFFADLTLNVAMKSVELENLFTECSNGTQKKPILIEAGPGCGKTTLALKILHDWAADENYVEQFDFVLSIELGTYKGDLQLALEAALGLNRVKDVTPSHLKTILESSEYEVLVILDGLDEVQASYEKSLTPLFQKMDFGHFQLVVTSRSEKLFPSNTIQSGARVGGERSFDFKSFFTIANINSLSEENASKLYKKFFEGESSEILSKSGGVKMLQCPLVLVMLAQICADAETVLTSTELYSRLHDFVIKRCKDKPRPGQNDPFVGCPSPFEDLKSFAAENQFTTLFSKLGEVALECLRNEKLTFSENELQGAGAESTVVRHLGLCHVSCVKKSPFAKPVITYEPIHKSLLEFWAAFHLWVCWKQSKFDFKDKVLALKRLFKEGDKECSLYSFLTGLLGPEAEILYNLLQSQEN